MDASAYTFYTIQSRMMDRLTSIYYHLGEVQARHLHRPAPNLEKAYRVSAVHATLALEGNPLEPLPVAELVSRPVRNRGPEALEVVNTHSVLALLEDLDPAMAPDLRRAHGVLMHGLAIDAGYYRTGPMEVVYSEPPPLRVGSAENLPAEVEELLHTVENDDASPVITSCVLHYGLAYLRPFSAGNGRLARMWQRRLLMRQWPVFAFLPTEAFILRTEPAYYAALEYADRQGDCGGFITYLLERIDEALAELLGMPDPVRRGVDRVDLFLQQAPSRTFRRKDYLAVFPSLSTASGSRDLRDAVDSGRLQRDGDGRATVYRKCGAL